MDADARRMLEARATAQGDQIRKELMNPETSLPLVKEAFALADKLARTGADPSLVDGAVASLVVGALVERRERER